jgi:hypothetical protein
MWNSIAVLARHLPALSLFVSLLLAAASPARAQTMYVASAQVDTASGQLVVLGAPFAAGIRVFLRFVELTVTSVSPSEIRATMPAGPLPPGSHSLILFQPGTGQVAFFSLAVGTAPGVLKVDLAAPTTFAVTGERYVVEATAASVGQVVPLDHALVQSLCRDKDGCEVTVSMINWDGAGQSASRTERLFLSETGGGWRFANIDVFGVDAASGSQDHAVFDCYLSDAETYTGVPNGRADAGAGFGLLNTAGGGYSDITTTCRVVIID